MKLKSIWLAVLFATSAATAQAGNFVSLTTGNGTTLCSIDEYNPGACQKGGLVDGLQDQDSDPFYLSIVRSQSTFLSGAYGQSSAIPSSLKYNTTNDFGDVTGSSTLSLLSYRVNTNVNLLPNVAQGNVYDFVFRDSVDNKLVFGTRFINLVANDQEVNYIFRNGAGDNPSVAWIRLSGSDLRMYQAGQTSNYSYDMNVPYTPGVVRMKADISVSESNPWGGLYLVKTDATAFTVSSTAITLSQAGEEGQAVSNNTIAGYASTTISNGVNAGSTTDAYGGTYGSAGTSSNVSGVLNVKTGNATFNGDVAVTNGGVVNTAVGATSTFNGAFNQQVGALLNGGGTFTFNGGYSAGNSPGAVTIDGDVVFGTTNASLFEIAGVTLGTEYDHVAVNGNLTFGGVLNVVFLNGFTASAGQTFDLFDFNSATGTFSTLNLATLGAGLAWNTANLYTNGSLSVISTVPTTPVPEPESYALMMLGLGVICSMVRRQKK